MRGCRNEMTRLFCNVESEMNLTFLICKFTFCETESKLIMKDFDKQRHKKENTSFKKISYQQTKDATVIDLKRFSFTTRISSICTSCYVRTTPLFDSL